MSYANCHLVEISIRVSQNKLNLSVKRNDEDCKFVDVTHLPRFKDIVTKAKFCSHCDQHPIEET